MAVRPIPEGYHTATPYLVVEDAERAIEFYDRAFGATELFRLTTPDGTIVHAEVRVGDSPIMLAGASPDLGTQTPGSLGGATGAVHLYVEDVDGLAQRAITAGAEELIPVADQFYGDRSGRLRDPFGHIWVIATRREDLTPAEMNARLEDLMAE